MQRNQDNNFTPQYYTSGQEQPARKQWRKGSGLAAAFLTMLIINPVLLILLKAVGSLIAVGLVIYFCSADTKVRPLWRVVAAVILVGLIVSQYNTLILHK